MRYTPKQVPWRNFAIIKGLEPITSHCLALKGQFGESNSFHQSPSYSRQVPKYKHTRQMKKKQFALPSSKTLTFPTMEFSISDNGQAYGKTIYVILKYFQ